MHTTTITKRKILISGILMSLFFFVISVYALSCEIKESCSEEENKILGLSDTYNAHFELAEYGDYPYMLCCKDVEVEVSDECGFLSLSSETNAHAAEAGVYPINLCLKNGEDNYICKIKDSCELNEVCVLSLSSNISAHGGDCKYYGKKLCCKIGSPLDIDFDSNKTIDIINEKAVIEVTAGEIVDVYLALKNNYKLPQDMKIELEKITYKKFSGKMKEVTEEWKNNYLVNFCKSKGRFKGCEEKIKIKRRKHELKIPTNKKETFLFRVFIPPNAEILSNYTAEFKIFSGTLGKEFSRYVIFKVVGGKINTTINAIITDTNGNPQRNKEVTICICKGNVKWCDESRAIYSYRAKTDENGVLRTRITPVLVLGKKYKLSLITEKGYAETIIQP